MILVAGIGNVFLGDDGFGVEVARRLLTREWPADVRVMDAGIRGFDLTFALADADAAILVDTISGPQAPGTLMLLELNAADESAARVEHALIDTHGMNPDRVLALLGRSRPRTLVVGCVPQDFGGEDGRLGLSPPVSAVIDDAVALVERALAQVRHA